MKIDGVSVAAISDALGHTTTITTEHYIKSLPNEQLKLMSSSSPSSEFIQTTFFRPNILADFLVYHVR
jgi:hypothetical protein